ncbi:MAG: RIP metalloprotease RseP [SAR324 cluster bacterium]|nr:RIP metalloprotease RseP [SAR324 cluster bacterium]MBL7034992.1 RIP metalloprotease RseP [SAR324 cluster bacterium]
MTTILSFLAVLGILIFIHELGHYLAARHVGVRVEAFSIGFPPTAWGKQIGETEYRISWVPLGGYVKLFGQNVSDENPDDPTNYAAKSIFQRLYILVAGPLMNLLFALIIMPLVFWIGMDVPAYLNEVPRIQNILSGGYAQKLGVLPNDEIIAVNANPVKNWEELHSTMGQISPADSFSLEVYRGGNSVALEGSAHEMLRAGSMGWSPFMAPVVGGFTKLSPAQQAGIRVGDLVSAINNSAIQDWSEISPAIQTIMNSKLDSANNSETNIAVELQRNGELLLVEVVPYLEENSQRWLLGMSMSKITRSHSFTESVKLGTFRLWFLSKATFGFLAQMFQGEGSMDDLGGPVKIGMVIGDAVRSGLADLLFLMSFISLQLGIFNLLPIPALDGGHIFMLLIEKINGAPLSVALRERSQMLGFSVLISLMIFVTWNDLVSLL